MQINFRKVIHSIFFLSIFMLLRRYTVGYHAGNFCLCYLESMLILYRT
ncbi:accessory gene regulator B family protein [Butyrivibrio fibrisolvens]